MYEDDNMKDRTSLLEERVEAIEKALIKLNESLSYLTEYNDIRNEGWTCKSPMAIFDDIVKNMERK